MAEKSQGKPLLCSKTQEPDSAPGWYSNAWTGEHGAAVVVRIKS